MPTERDREERRKAEKLLETEYGWPEPRAVRPRWAVLLVDALVIILGTIGLFLLFGWRP